MNSIRAFRWVLGSVIVLAALRAAPAYPAPGPIHVLTLDPVSADTLYAGTGDGVWKSTDGGASWSLTGLHRVTYSLAVAPTNPSTVYAGTDAGVFKSTDGGASWPPTELTSGNAPVLAIDPSAPSTVYAGGEAGLFRSTDGGETWLTVMNLPVRSLAVDPASSGTVYAGMAFSSVLKSTDGGETWTLSFRPYLSPDALGYGEPQMSALAIDQVAPSIVYVGNGTAPACCPDGTAGFEDAQGGAIFRSTDAGATWQATTMGTYWFSEVHVLAVDRQTAGTVYALRDRMLYKSVDVGETWHGLSPGGASSVSVHALAIDSRTGHATTIYVDTNLGLFKSTDGGATWSAPGTPSQDTAPPDTSITLATDGAGVALANEGITASTAVRLTFTGTDDTGLARFECRLGSAGFSACTSPVTHSGLTAGHYTFDVRAVDTSGNVDLTPRTVRVDRRRPARYDHHWGCRRPREIARERGNHILQQGDIPVHGSGQRDDRGIRVRTRRGSIHSVREPKDIHGRESRATYVPSQGHRQQRASGREPSRLHLDEMRPLAVRLSKRRPSRTTRTLTCQTS